MPKVEIPCKNCGIKFVEYLCKKKEFCGYRCSSIYKGMIRRKNTKKMTICCEFCKKEFTILECQFRAKKGYKFCSQYCRDESRKRKYKICLQCKKEFYPERNSQIFCSNSCSAINKFIRLGKDKKKWMENGYWVLYRRYDKPIKEHIKIMEDHIGRKLEKDEIVHHINEIRTDNRIENLKLMTRGEHSKYHRHCDKKSGKVFFQRRNNHAQLQ